MPVLNLNQITDKLNAEFSGVIRKIVFWYDDNARFINSIDSFEIIGAKLHKLTLTNQFSTKHLLEREDTESNYLLYAPFPKPPAAQNALEDIWRYSRHFNADLASIIIEDLSIKEEYKPVIQKHIDFFSNAKRTKRFYGYENDAHTKETIEIALMSALCMTQAASFDEVLREVLIKGDFADNPCLDEFIKYDLLSVFWRMCDDELGYSDNIPSLLRLATMLLVTYTSRQLKGETPSSWSDFISPKSGNVITFLDMLMNHSKYELKYTELATDIARALNIRQVFENVEIEDIINCDAFKDFDYLIIKWIIERLLDEDIGASCGEYNIPAICDMRMKMHYGKQFTPEYKALLYAVEIFNNVSYTCPEMFDDIVKQYTSSDYIVDQNYRHFYVAYDCIKERESFEKLRESVEGIYTNKYLGKLLPVFNVALDVKAVMNDKRSQLCFFSNYIKTAKDKVAVIISDALRYEIGCELYEKLSNHQNYEIEDIKHMYAVLPAYTQLGMAALLPHKSLEILEDGKVLVDNKPSDATEKREIILRSVLPESQCISYKQFIEKKSNRAELREVFKSKAIYVYHNRIDNTGENSEIDVFRSCSSAVDEIYELIDHLYKNANIINFIVTTDHGFLYKRDKFNESEKISLEGMKGSYIDRRFIIADDPVDADGIASTKLSNVIGGDENRYISWPIGASVFKTRGGGLNYVHGGASPQEMIIPLIIMKAETGKVETKFAKIALVSTTKKITNLITHLDFIQKKPICDIVKPMEYTMYFISEDNEKITNEQTYIADSTEDNPNKRMFRLKFSFKNKTYDKNKQYWLIAVNADPKNRMEVLKHPVSMDIAFADGIDFSFDL